MRISDWSSDVCSSDLTILEMAIEEMNGWRFNNIEKTKNDKCQQLGQQAVGCKPQDQPEGYYFVPDHAAVVWAPHLGSCTLTRPAPQCKRSEARRVGKECVRTCSSRWAP